MKKVKKESHTSSMIIYGVYIKLIEGIKHFDGIQTIYRSLSSTLLLASFAAIGFIYSEQVKVLPFSRFTSVIFVCSLGIIALTSLWALDLIFQERLLISNFVEALKLERKHPWLPQVHNNMISRGEHYGAPSRKVIYYIGCSSCLFLIMGISYIYTYRDGSYSSWVPVGAITIFAIFLYSVALVKATGRFENFVQKILNSKSKV